MVEILKINSLKELESFAKKFSSNIKKGDILGLIGDLGSGKTQFTKYFVKALGGNAEEVVSPTFTILNEYDIQHGKLYHFDLYRLNSIYELEDIGYKDFFYSREIVVVEWINMIPEVVNEATILISFNIIDENIREVSIKRRNV